MRSELYGCVKKKSKHSAAVMADIAPAIRPPTTAAMRTGHDEGERHVVVVEVAAQRQHQDREPERAEHADRDPDEVGAVFGLAGRRAVCLVSSAASVRCVQGEIQVRARSTVFSPSMPSGRFWVCAATRASTCAGGRLRAFATRAACSRAFATEISGRARSPTT